MQLQLFKHSFQALGGSNEFQVYAPTERMARTTFALLEGEVRTVEKVYSRYQPGSVITRINASAGLGPVEVDEETAGLLDFAAKCFEMSGGLFDITSGVLRKAWDFKSGKLPSKKSVEELLPLIGWDKVEWKRPFIRLPVRGMEIDFGGIGKEYAVDRVASRCAIFGVESALIDLGGDIRVTGPHPNGQPWSIGVKHPRELGVVIDAIALSHGAIATSGDYERFLEVRGKRYAHLLNPKTGWPVESFASVTVMGDSCLVAGSASTTAMLLGEEKGEKFLKELGVHAVTVTPRLKVHRITRDRDL